MEKPLALAGSRHFHGTRRGPLGFGGGTAQCPCLCAQMRSLGGECAFFRRDSGHFICTIGFCKA